MALDRLPVELIDGIVRFVSSTNPRIGYTPAQRKRDDVKRELAKRVKLAPLATISTEWQKIVESHLFSSLWIESEDWETFLELLARRERRKYVKYITLTISGSAMSEGLAFRGSVGTSRLSHLQQEHWQRLSDSVRTLYSELDSWGEDLAIVGLSLEFPKHPVIANADRYDQASIKSGIPYQDLSACFPPDFTLPEWPTVKKLSVRGNEHRVSTSFLWKLAKACPNLVSWRVEADELERLHADMVLGSRIGTYGLLLRG
jgi:hypothetical protein